MYKLMILIFVLAASTSVAQESRSKVGIRPWPTDSAHEMTGGGQVAHWKPGIGNYDAMLKADDYTAKHMDVVKGYNGAFHTNQRFFEHYIHQQGGDWVDTNPETNRLVRTIRDHEQAGTIVKHIIICREGWLYDPVNGDTGPIAGDPRILFQRDVDDQRQVFKDAYALGLIKHDNYKLIQMILHPAVFLDDPEARAIISTMDGICYESHHFNRYWPLGSSISDPEEVARGAQWVLEQGMDYIFYYGPYQYKDCDTYIDFLERDWLHSFWDRGLPKHHPNMHYYLNAFPHSCGSQRPVGPESDPHSYLGFARWLIQELSVLSPYQRSQDETRWLKGNIHTHSFWSDGDHVPELVIKEYKDLGYDFLALTDHNILHKTPTTGPLHQLLKFQDIIDGQLYQRRHKNHPAIVKYLEAYADEWVDYEYFSNGDSIRVRVKTFDEYRHLFEKTDKFLLIQGNEISEKQAVHAVVLHQDETLPLTEGGTRVELIRHIVNEVASYRERTGRNVFPILAHPNFMYAITAEMMIEVDDIRFFELYNGHPIVNNDGDGYRASTERMWDIVLAHRLSNDTGPILYAAATDDAHNYHRQGATPGRGWIMVKSDQLTPEAINDAIDRGDFYPSTGVILKNIRFKSKKLILEIEPEEGVTYLTEFIGTRKGFNPESTPTLDAEGAEISNTTRTYSEEIGEILYTSNELQSSYRLTGDEIYVRARVTASASQHDQISGEVIGQQRAWSQPYTP